MKLVLCSEGFHTQNTVQECVKLVGKPQDEITVGIINEAHVAQTSDKHWVIRNLRSVADNFKAEIDIVNLLALSLDSVEQRLMSKDVIYVLGGDADYLMTVYQKTGFDKLLPKLLETKVYVGSSAGSMVIGKRVPESIYQKTHHGERRKHRIEDYLGLVDFSIVPHLDAPGKSYRRDVLLESFGEIDSKVYGLNDDSAVIANDDEIYTIGSTPIIVENGKMISS